MFGFSEDETSDEEDLDFRFYANEPLERGQREQVMERGPRDSGARLEDTPKWHYSKGWFFFTQPPRNPQHRHFPRSHQHRRGHRGRFRSKRRGPTWAHVGVSISS